MATCSFGDETATSVLVDVLSDGRRHESFGCDAHTEQWADTYDEVTPLGGEQ